MPIWLELFLQFLKIGTFTFGGGYAMIALIEDACVNRKKWITHDEMMDVTVIAESTPGPVAINCATYVGVKRDGLRGAVAATLGVVIPSFVIILVISLFLDRFMEIELVAKAFSGIRIGVGILILNAGINMIRKTKKTPMVMGIMIVSGGILFAAGIFGLGISSIALMVAAGIFSGVVYVVDRHKAGKEEKA